MQQAGSRLGLVPLRPGPVALAPGLIHWPGLTLLLPPATDWPQERREEAGKPWNPATGSPPLIFAGGPTATSNPGAETRLLFSQLLMYSCEC